jgi:hypothetical protein
MNAHMHCGTALSGGASCRMRRSVSKLVLGCCQCHSAHLLIQPLLLFSVRHAMILTTRCFCYCFEYSHHILFNKDAVP